MASLHAIQIRATHARAAPRCTGCKAKRRSTLTCKAQSSITAASQTDTTQLGQTGVTVPSLGVGAWSWGDRSGYWGYGREYGREESSKAYQAMMSAGLTFLDTAEVYGFGKSEEFVGEFARETGTSPLVATKYAPVPWRFTSGTVVNAAKASLSRLQQEQLTLYMIHWPGFLTNFMCNDAFVRGLGQVQQAGLAQAVGVSNFTADRVRRAVKVLGEVGVPLASNQVQYSLLYRKPETNGVLAACRDNGVTLVAYSPLCQGLLTGKYTVGGQKPSGPRGGLFNDSRIREIEPLLQVLKEIGDAKGKSRGQVAINWCIAKGALPIPGVKNERQVQEVAGALGWRLDAGEVAELDKISSRVPTSLGAPFENW